MWKLFERICQSGVLVNRTWVSSEKEQGKPPVQDSNLALLYLLLCRRQRLHRAFLTHRPTRHHFRHQRRLSGSSYTTESGGGIRFDAQDVSYRPIFIGSAFGAGLTFAESGQRIASGGLRKTARMSALTVGVTLRLCHFLTSVTVPIGERFFAQDPRAQNQDVSVAEVRQHFACHSS